MPGGHGGPCLSKPVNQETVRLQWGHARRAWRAFDDSGFSVVDDALQWGHARRAWRAFEEGAAGFIATALQWGHARRAWRARRNCWKHTVPMDFNGAMPGGHGGLHKLSGLKHREAPLQWGHARRAWRALQEVRDQQAKTLTSMGPCPEGMEGSSKMCLSHS